MGFDRHEDGQEKRCKIGLIADTKDMDTAYTGRRSILMHLFNFLKFLLLWFPLKIPKKYKKKNSIVIFVIVGVRNLTRSLESTQFQNPGMVPGA